MMARPRLLRLAGSAAVLAPPRLPPSAPSPLTLRNEAAMARANASSSAAGRLLPPSREAAMHCHMARTHSFSSRCSVSSAADAALRPGVQPW
jgi:hypothetical protein